MKISFKGQILDLNLCDVGVGNAVLILHGWGTSMNVYKGMIDYISQYRRVISYDIPGFGNSSEPSWGFSTDDYAELALAVLKELEISEVTLIGHSHGGRTILNIASRQNIPVLIDKIILIDSAGIVPKKSVMFKLKVAAYKFGKKILSCALVTKLFPNALEMYKSKHGSADYRAVSGVMRDSLTKIVNDDYKARLEKIKAPTLLLWGTNDDATPLSDAVFMEKTIPDCGLVKIEGGTHYSFLDNPTLTKRVIYSFLGIKE